jgi:hypothetical protein
VIAATRLARPEAVAALIREANELVGNLHGDGEKGQTARTPTGSVDVLFQFRRVVVVVLLSFDF